MITTISDSNISLFEHLIPDDLIEDLRIRKDTIGIGCLRRDEDGKFDGYGVLIYVVEFEDKKPENYNIKWLYVDSNRRNEDVASELLTDLFWDFGNTLVPTITVDIPALSTYEDLGNFFGDWHFEFKNTYDLDFEIEISKLKDHVLLADVTKDSEIKGVKSLSDVDNKSISIFLKEMEQKYIKRDMYVDPMLTEYVKDYFDPDLSSVVIKDGVILAALLVHTRPSGRIDIVVFDTLNDDKQIYLVGLMKKSYQAVLLAGKEHSSLYYYCRNERGMNFIDGMFGTHETPLVMRGMIQNSSLGISSEQWEDIKDAYWQENPEMYDAVKELYTGSR
ncbi:hypothetical protein [Pseudobutyrivibrio sp. MD2005]|uniref:hypothetical protein n=1 Tax=Pseudobutyrivibrio sp. MD2005 TaxID=1410616 RepID=UPI000481E22A|nr:hypothetical protein [Pseudobutyrivibrio sp. MD2005]